MLYDSYGRELSKYDIADAIDIARQRADEVQEIRAMQDAWIDSLNAKINRGELTYEQAKRKVFVSNLLALIFMPIGMFLAILSPFALIFVATYPLQTLCIIVGIVYLCKRRKSKPVQASIECSRCRNLDPANLKGGNFSCTVCGYTMT